jgi:pyruvate,water dikinase
MVGKELSQYSMPLRYNNFTGLKYILPIAQCTKEQLEKVGGKNASLGELARGGFNVPPGFAVSTEAYKVFVKGEVEGKIRKILSEEKNNPHVASLKIQELITQTPLPTSIEEEVLSAYGVLVDIIKEELGENSPSFAVRSSATAEDLPHASFAGQHDTYLFVRGEKEILDKLKACWASLYTPRAITYREAMGLPHEKALMSVGIIKMIDARSAGVIFTLDPTTGSRLDVVIESNFGVGESVVKGITSVDRFVVNKVTLKMKERIIQRKQVMVVYDELGGVVEKEIPPKIAEAPSLSEEEAIYLAEVAKKIEEYFGSPQDIEFAIEKSGQFPKNVFILQSRPETKWSKEQQTAIFNLSGSHVTDYLLGWFTSKV